MDDAQLPSDVVISRINLQLMRSRSILQSWTSLKQEADDGADGLVDNDNEFVTSGDHAGVGVVPKGDSEFAIPTRNSASKDKLLEQLIGKKAANAKRREDAHKSMSASKHAAPKPMVKDVKKVTAEEDSDSDEEGRAAAFTSKKASKPRMQAPAVGEVSDAVNVGVENDVLPPVKWKHRDYGEQDAGGASEKPRPSKRQGGGSYLDELLAKKAKKSKKKKTRQEA